MKKAKIASRSLAILLALIMALSLLPASAAAVEIEIRLSYFNADASGFPIARRTLTVAPGLSEEYGYADAYYGAAATALDAIVAAHIALFGSDRAVLAQKLAVSGSGLTNFMGTGGADYVCFVNGELPGAGPGLIKLGGGDVVELFAMQDGYMWSDAYVWFELDGGRADKISVGTGEAFTLTLAGTDFAVYGAYGSFPAEFDEYAVVVDMLTDTPAAVFNGLVVCEESDGGAVELAFDAPGVYYLTAVGETCYESPLMGAWLEVTVSDGHGAAVGTSEVVNPPAAPGSPGEPGVTWDAALVNTLNYIAQTRAPAPVYGDEWEIMTLARGGYAVPADYFEGYYESVKAALVAQNTNKPKEPGGGANQPTTNARLVLALTAIGVDATSVGGFNLLAPLTDLAAVKAQGLNAALYALLAMDSKPYAADAATKDALIEFILSLELSGGGFNWGWGTDAEPDMTAMVIQALAPYKGRTEVADAVVRALDALENMQEFGGGYASWGAIGAENSAQVIVAAAALDMNPAVDFIKDKTAYSFGYDGAGNDNPLCSMLRFYMDTGAGIGGFQSAWALGGVDPLATQQATCALVAYERYLNGGSTLYDMSDCSVTLGTLSGLNTYLLRALISKAQALSQTDYTSASRNAMASSLDAAKAALADSSATQADINKAASELNAAINALTTDAGGGDVTSVNVTLSVTGDTVILSAAPFAMPGGATAFDLLRKALDERGVSYVYSGAGAGVYIKSIGGLAEFDRGPNSGWTYSVNGVKPGAGIGAYTLRQGDAVAFTYTDDYTADSDAGSWAGGPDSGGDGGWVNPFVDVNEGDWFYAAVKYAHENGLMNGAGNNFDPNGNLTRAMMITILARAHGVDASEDGAWYGAAALWGAANGITDGHDMGRDITREQAVTMLFRYAKLLGQDTSKTSSLAAYADADRVSGWAKPAMEWAVAESLMKGRTDTSLEPQGAITRAEAAALLMRFGNISK